MQAVDVLRHQRVDVGSALELREREVARVGFAREQLAAGAVAPHVAAVLGVLHVVLDVRLAFGLRVLGPDTLRAAEVGDARLGRDAGAGEHHDLACVAQQRGEAIELVGVGHHRDVTRACGQRARDVQ